MHKNACLRRQAGFTLVETLVAITILMIAIAGPLTVAEKGLSAAIYARDQLIGSYLAQDGMEYIKNTVDSNELAIQSSKSTNDWLYDGRADTTTHELSDCSTSNGSSVCVIDTTDGGIEPGPSCPSSMPCPPLYLTPSGYTLEQGANPSGNTGQTTTFTRYFYLQLFNVNGGTNTAANVVVVVTWPGDVTGGGGVTLEDTFYNTPLQ